MSFSFVTALYNINRDKYDGRNYKQYQEWFSKTLLVPVPMIIYTEEENRTLIENVRANLPTKVIYTKFEDIPFYNTRNNVKDIITNSDFKYKIKHPNGLENICYDYIPIVNSKFVWMKDAIKENYFNTDMYFWIDAGLSRFMKFNMDDNIFNTNLINELNNSNKLFIQIGKEKELSDLINETIKFEDCIGQNINFMMAGFWGGNADLVKEICEIGGQMYITEYINKKRVDNEQVIFGHIIKKYIKQIYLIRNTSRQEYINYYLFCNKVN
tara:strand:+ start:4660 stop:5466 length:807 start_codon:yes stop_codon:yes gene_type:complete